ncbi:MAG: hypothetical protein ACJA2W_000433 [Planctomycetota bacterium]|jgi:hypothetical protein
MEHTIHQLARVRIAGLSDKEHVIVHVEPKVSLPRASVRPVAIEAVLRKDRKHFAIEIDGVAAAGQTKNEREAKKTWIHGSQHTSGERAPEPCIESTRGGYRRD